ncbi:MAG TPA: hypothetical protein DEQ02_02445 [Ruminococcaceae bacterium]|nr:hypothetical protein [Oscillospiraceae bacterium]
MKKMIVATVMPFILGAAGLCGVLILIFGGGDSDKPIATPASNEQAEKYYGVSNEIGVPWDLCILIDTFISDKDGKSDIEDLNPLLTSLNFCKLQCDYYLWDSSADDDSGDWVFDHTSYISGRNAILTAMRLGNDATVSDLSKAMKNYDQTYSDREDKRETFIVTAQESEFRDILDLYYNTMFDSKEIDQIIELYESRYLYYLYLEGNPGVAWTPGAVDLPPIVVGSVNRLDIVNIAVQIIDAPYLLGGKSPYAGPPLCALDCSGYVDWVYMQAFGETVSGNLGGTTIQLQRCEIIDEDELKIGDLGFYYWPNEIPSDGYNHVGIYVGKINGKDAFIHCGGPYWGYPGRDSGRVIVSINDQGRGSTKNLINPMGGTFSGPEMLASNFVIFARPQFQFIDDVEEEETDEDEPDEETPIGAAE